MKNVTTRQRADAASNIVTTELHDIHKCYYKNLSYEEFLKYKLYPNSKDLKIVESRCIYRGIIETIVTKKLISSLSDHLGDVALFGPTSSRFVRVAFPNMTSNGFQSLDNVVNSPLHYDNYYNVNTRTTWIPLQDINADTGSLCYTNNEELIRLSGKGISPAEFHCCPNKKWGDHYVALLKNEIKEVYCSLGDAVVFDKSVLHGATYPKSKPRLSVDIRWIHPSPNLEGIDLKKAVTSSNILLKNYVHRLLVDSRDSVFSKQTSKRLKHDSLLALYKLEDYAFIRKVEPLALNKFRAQGILRTFKYKIVNNPKH